MKIVYDGTLDPRQCKAVLGETIPALAAEDPDVIYLDADLMNCIGTAKWAAEHPERADRAREFARCFRIDGDGLR